ncbi:MAG TPA: carboxylesterase family protein [Streptosporangiaceae bacterium]|nr:carboxylesterase family protein [Streptosporangiaceae bacterium]
MPRCQSRWRTLRRRGAAVIATSVLAAVTVSCTGQGTAAGPRVTRSGLVVSLSDGQLRGKQAGSTNEYLGIPYAAPPVGPLRWRPPQPPAHWHGVRAATTFAPHCPQPAGVFGRASTSEDCLFLNVFAPAGRRGSRLPVMVWIHGGGFVGGESDDYDPSGLVADGVIVVTINYRLGALGFLADPALASHPGGPTGDYGLMDQQAALRWVQRNIREFGGDPRNVTLFGESAGGQSVLLQLISPGARGLFAKAIAESGGYALNPVSLASAEAAGRAFAAKAGCASQTARCLRSLPVATILADQDPSGASADIDGLVLTQQLKAALTSGDFSHVPVIDGSNHDEWRLFVALAIAEGHPVTAANYQPMIATTLRVSRRIAGLIAARYPLSHYKSPALALSAVGTDAIFSCPTLLLDQDLARYVPTYAYEFSDENAPSPYPSLGFPYGAAHSFELPYLFTLRAVPPSLLSASQKRLAATMREDWTSFARSGVPSAAGAPPWPRFTAASQSMLALAPPVPAPETDFSAEHQCSFWARGGD